MMFSYHSIPDLEKSLLDSEKTDSEPETPLPSREYICCCKDTRYIFYVLYLLMIILFLVFIIIVIANYTADL